MREISDNDRARMKQLIDRIGKPRAAIAFNGGQGREPAIGAAMVSCPYLGPPTPELLACESCPGKKTMLRVFKCGVFGTCLPTVSVPGRGFCGRCPHRPVAGDGGSRDGQQLRHDQGDGQGGEGRSIGS